MERRATQSERFWQISVVLHFIRFSLCHKKAWKTVSARLFRFFKTLLYFFSSTWQHTFKVFQSRAIFFIHTLSAFGSQSWSQIWNPRILKKFEIGIEFEKFCDHDYIFKPGIFFRSLVNRKIKFPFQHTRNRLESFFLVLWWLAFAPH